MPLTVDGTETFSGAVAVNACTFEVAVTTGRKERVPVGEATSCMLAYDVRTQASCEAPRPTFPPVSVNPAAQVPVTAVLGCTVAPSQTAAVVHQAATASLEVRSAGPAGADRVRVTSAG